MTAVYITLEMVETIGFKLLRILKISLKAVGLPKSKHPKPRKVKHYWWLMTIEDSITRPMLTEQLIMVKHGNAL